MKLTQMKDLLCLKKSKAAVPACRSRTVWLADLRAQICRLRASGGFLEK